METLTQPCSQCADLAASLAAVQEECARLKSELEEKTREFAECASMWCPYEKRMHEAEAQLQALQAQIATLREKWEQQAVDAIAESSRIRSVTHQLTGAEERCLTRAETWRKCRADLAALPTAAVPPDGVK